MPMMPLSGVRISWLMLVMNSDLIAGFERGLASGDQLRVLVLEFGQQTSAGIGQAAHHQRLGGGGPGFVAQLNFAGPDIAVGELFAMQQIAQLRLGDGKVDDFTMNSSTPALSVSRTILLEGSR